ncbi:FAD-binding protein [Micromonospora terminaliae]|uniref:FAD-binding protein n=1 Tax=Micromonospora terminaliae TaxID=1914461 RepID=A0AAJ2ZBI7_9ACTN|nr:D-arabinono-1,4-lactone oxidase [Micromonospora terminaliae]NES26306.1 FAD-binding protein [Micromonospora terminaliae]QGL50488.1 FAD-binding protein [Micromonospora terminaliae]
MAGTPAAWSNWAGNQRSTAALTVRPRTVEEVAEAVRHAADTGRTIRAVGSGHSFTGTAVADGHRLDLADLDTGVTIDTARRLVTVPAGTTLHTLNDLLARHGLAMPNLGDIDAQTVAGALSTGTHGTGGKLGCLSTFVTALTLVTGTGEVLRCSADEHRDVFAAARVGLGAVGVLVEVTLRCVDAFVLRAHERPAALAAVLDDLPGLVERHDHAEFYWFPYTDRVQVKANDRVPADDRPLPRWRGWLDDEFLSNTVFAGACRLGRAVPALAPGISAISARALTERTYTGRSDLVFCTPRRVRFVEMEYGLPRAALPTALAELRRIVDGLPFKVLFPVEVRFTAADDIWLSHGYGRDSAYVAIHQYVGMPYEPYFREFEKVAADLGGRPHWGKLHWRDAESLAEAYPKFGDFLAVRDRLDPDRRFTNPYLNQVLGA